MKNKNIQRVLMGAGAVAGVFALAGCEDKSDAAIYSSVEECQANPPFDFRDESGRSWGSVCEDTFKSVQADHLKTAPRYESQQLCESEHGVGACGEPAPTIAQAQGSDATSQSSGSFFMPLMMGYLVGNMMSGGRSTYSSTPLYRSAGKPGYFSSKGNLISKTKSTFANPTKVTRKAFAAPKTTPKVMTKTSVKSRGGFGSSRTSVRSSGSRSFGG